MAGSDLTGRGGGMADYAALIRPTQRSKGY